MKIKEIRKLKKEDIAKNLKSLNSELIQLQGQAATGTPPKSPGQIKQIKQAVARLKTVLRELELESMNAGVKPVEEKKSKEDK